MKKKLSRLLLLFLVLIHFSSFAKGEREITFQDIPWLSDEKTTFEILNNNGFIRTGFGIPAFTDNDGVYIIKDEGINARPMTTRNYPDASLQISLAKIIKNKIAGYPVTDVLLTFAYNGTESKFISAKVVLFGAKYAEIYDKLCKVYGESETAEDDDGIVTNIWRGDNNSCVLLYSVNEGNIFNLIYGRLDAEEILIGCINANSVVYDPDDISGL